MELLLILTYAAICVAIFKIFRIPVNKWTLPTAALGGLFLIGLILLVMNYNHPFTDNARIYFATTPIMPDVKGRVIDVPVNGEIHSDPAKHRVAQHCGGNADDGLDPKVALDALGYRGKQCRSLLRPTRIGEHRDELLAQVGAFGEQEADIGHDK